MEELLTVEIGVATAALVKVVMGYRKDGEPEASGAQPFDNGLGLWQGLAVGEGHIPLRRISSTNRRSRTRVS